MSRPPAAALAWGDLAVGLRAAVDFVVTPAEMQVFAELSGDFNPLHTDDGFAQGQGFERAVVYGGLIVAKVSQLIGMRLPGRDAVWTALDLQFRKPLLVGMPARVEGVVESLSEATGAVELKLEVRTADALIAKGRAETLLVRR